MYSTGVYVRLVFNIGMLFLLIHWHGCLQYYVDRLENFPANSWVVRFGIRNASWTSLYTWSVYGSTSMMMGVGMGVVEADNTTDSWLRCGCMATGHALQALLVGFCIDMITSMNFTRLRNRQRIRDLDDYMNYKMLPQQLRRRIRNYAENRNKGRVFDEAQIVSELSDPLRERVMWHNSRRLLQNLPFFARVDQDFLRDLVACMKMEFFLPQDVVAAAGTVGDRLYFLQSGSAHVINAEGVTVATVKPGDRFGEVCLLRDMMRVNTVITDTYCRFLSLTRADFDKVLCRHTDIRDLVNEIITERKLDLTLHSWPELSDNGY